MRKKVMPHVLLVSAVLLCLHCSMQPTVAGGVDDTGNFLTGAVVSADYVPQQACSVGLKRIVVTASGDSLAEERKTVTGADGVYSFKNVPRGRYALIAHHEQTGNSGIVSRITVGADSFYANKTCIISMPHALVGRVSDPHDTDYSSMVISIPGVASVRPDENGSYFFPSVPAGFFDLAFTRNTTVNYLPIEIEAIPNDTVCVRECSFAQSLNEADRVYSFYDHTLENAFAIVPSWFAVGLEPAWYFGKDFSGVRYFRTEGDTSFSQIDEKGNSILLVDNFDDGDKWSILHAGSKSGIWYAYNDAGDGGASLVYPDGVMGDFSKGITGAGAFSGKSVSCRFVLAPGAPSPFANIAVSLVPDSGKWANLAAMTSCTFFCKGSGRVSVRFVSSRVGNYPVDKSGHFGKLIDLPANWTKQTIELADLRPPAGSQQEADGLTWAEVRDSVRAVIFGTWGALAGDTVSLQLDDVYLNGMTAADLGN